MSTWWLDSAIFAPPRGCTAGTSHSGHFWIMISKLSDDNVYGNITYCHYHSLHKARGKSTGATLHKARGESAGAISTESARDGATVLYSRSNLRSQQSPVVGMPV